MDDSTSTDNENKREQKGENFEGSSADTKSEEETGRLSNGAQWLREKIAAFSDETRNGDIEEILKLDSESEILKAIVNLRKFELLKHLTKDERNFIANVNLDLWIELIKLSVEEEFFEIFQELKRFESSFDDDYEYKNLLDDISKLHKNIENGNFEEVEKFVQTYPNLKLCYGLSNFCALERSIKEKQFKIFAFLRSKGFEADDNHRLKRKLGSFRKDHTLYRLIRSLSDEQREEIKNQNLNFSLSNPNCYVDLVFQSCVLDGPSDESFFAKVKEVLKFLYTFEEFKPIIEILALSDIKKILFDPKNETISEVDPTRSSCVYGVCYGDEGIISVAKNLSLGLMIGTLIHELSHYVFYVIYENNYLPYRVEDKERERKWEKVVKITRKICEENPKNHAYDDIVRRVFNEDKTDDEEQNKIIKRKEKSELVVRVNQLIATYHKENQKLKEYRELYPELFDFYFNKILPDLSKENFQTLKINKNFKLFEQIENSNFQVKDTNSTDLLNTKQNLLIISDVPQMTLSKLFQEISKKSSNKLEPKVKNLFINFERLQQENLRKEFEEILKSSQEILRLVIHLKVDESQREEKIEESLQILTKFSGQIFLVASSESEKILKIAQKVFKIENSKVEMEGESLKFIEESETFESSQSSLKFLKVEVKNFWNDLTEKSREEILKLEIKFRGEIFSISSLFEENFSPQTLNFLSSQKGFEVKPKKSNEVKFYFERKFLKFKGTEDKIFDTESEERVDEENSSDDSESDDSPFYDSEPSDGENPVNFLTLEEFIYQSLPSKVVLISEIAGSGKTTLLHKIHQTLSEKFQNFWICFVSLLKHKKILLDRREISESFLDFLCDKILNLKEIEKKIFELKYERNEVVILFDGFDEISPDCKRNAMKIFKLHKESERSQIWITTRTHLEKDLEQKLQVKAHKIEPLNEEEQIEFLCKFWEKSCVDSDLREKCAKKLVEKIQEMSRGRFGLIGLVLQLRLLGELFEEELCEDFDEKIRNLSLSRVYEFLIERSVKFKEQDSVHDILKLHSDIYQVLALKRWTKDSEKFEDVSSHLFGRASLIEDLDEKLEELARDGIISYDENGEISFLHRTVEEFFVWLFAFNRIKNFKKNWRFEEDFCDFFFELLSSRDITRLDECFKELWKSFDEKSQKNFEGANKFAKIFTSFVIEKKENNNFFRWTRESNFFSHSTLFAFKAIKFASVETFQKIIESKEVYDKDSFSFYVNTSFLSIKDPEICEEFLDEVFTLFPPDNSKLFDFLMRKDKYGRTIFHDIGGGELYELEILKIFWLKVEKRKISCENVKQIFFDKDKWGRNFFTEALFSRRGTYNPSDRIDFLIEIMKRNLNIELQKQLLREVKLGMCENEKVFLRVFEYLKVIYSAEEIFEVLTSVDEEEKTFLHHAAEESCPAVMKFFVEEVLKKKQEDFIKKFLLTRDKEGKNALMISVLETYSFHNNFVYFFDKIFLEFFNFKEFAFEVDEKGWNILHFLVFQEDFENFEHFIERAQFELSEEDFKKFYQQKTKKLENIFHLIVVRKNIYSSYDVKSKIKLLAKILTRDEMRIFLSDVDDEGRLPLHNATNDAVVFLITFNLYKNNFPAEEILKFFEAKDENGKNVLHLSEMNKYVKDAKREIEEIIKNKNSKN